MSRPGLSRTTHTAEMRQITELNVRIAEAGGQKITAGFLGLAGVMIDRVTIEVTVAARTARQTTVPALAVLLRIIAVGSPSFPYLYGVFEASDADPSQVPAPLHTPHLRALSELYRLRHTWGV